jgi:hypothetical protein
VGNPEALLDGLLWVDSAVERPLNGDFAVGPLLAGSCRWRSSLADIPASVCFRDQRQAVVDPVQTVVLQKSGRPTISVNGQQPTQIPYWPSRLRPFVGPIILSRSTVAGWVISWRIFSQGGAMPPVSRVQGRVMLK